MKLVERYLRANRELARWNLKAYVPWARRHEPFSFAVGPLILGGAVVLLWFGFGLGLRKALLYFLVPAVALLLVSAAIGLWVGRQGQHGKPD